MASVAQIEANRANARKSTGPRTPEGKERASRNAVKHGLLAEQVVIHGEDPAEFDGYRDRMLGELAPVSEVEAMLAERAVSLAWRLRRAERLQSAVFARVYRENADDVVLWPKHGLPIAPGPDEEEVILGQVVMADFGHAQVLDRLLVYERRIEGSLYRTMAELRREKQARLAAGLEEGGRSEGCPSADQQAATAAQLGSFGEEGKRTPYGVTTNGIHGRDARETKEPAELGSFGAERDRGTRASQVEEDHGRDPRHAGTAGTPYGVTANLPASGAARCPGIPSFKQSGLGPDTPPERQSCETNPISGERTGTDGTERWSTQR